MKAKINSVEAKASGTPISEIKPGDTFISAGKVFLRLSPVGYACLTDGVYYPTDVMAGEHVKKIELVAIQARCDAEIAPIMSSKRITAIIEIPDIPLEQNFRERLAEALANRLKVEITTRL